MLNFWFLCAAVIGLSAHSAASEITVEMFAATKEGLGAKVGSVLITRDENGGTAFTASLTGMLAGSEHGFHVHTNPTCAPAEKDGVMVPALAAGGHWDPGNTGKHEGALGNGHLGDLPRLTADSNGHVNLQVTAPRIKNIGDLKGHALMVHLKGDNYSDIPARLGGGGPRLFCGVIE